MRHGKHYMRSCMIPLILLLLAASPALAEEESVMVLEGTTAAPYDNGDFTVFDRKLAWNPARLEEWKNTAEPDECQSALNIDPLSASKIDPPEQASGGRRWSLEKQTYPPLVHGPACLKHIGGAVYKGWISLAGPSGLWPGPSGWAVEGASPIRNGS